MTDPAPLIPVALRVHLAHAVVQAVADQAGVDILHIKGPAAQGVRGLDRPSVDADVLVRPSHLKRFSRALEQSGWERVTDLYSGGLVEHSANWYHPQVGQLDLHVRFPGILLAPEQAFDHLWGTRVMVEIAHRPVPAPGAPAHRLIVLLHAARNPGARTAEVVAAWHDLADEDRLRVRDEAATLRADTALSAVLGDFETGGRSPDFAMWRLYADGISDAPTLSSVLLHARASPHRRFKRLRTLGAVLHLVATKRRRMAVQLGRPPTLVELAHGYGGMVEDNIRAWRRRRRSS